jgi:hypothetical protein
MSNTDKIELFMKWYSQSGHWIYSSRGHALNTWATRGIENLPDAPKGVGLYPNVQAWIVS